MKKFIRAILKLPLTPFAIGWFFIGIFAGVAILIGDWIYGDKSFNESTWALRNAWDEIKNWFTTI